MRRLVQPAGSQQRDPAKDRVQGGSQLMRHRGKEFVLQPAEALRLHAKILLARQGRVQLAGALSYAGFQLLVGGRERGVRLKQVDEHAHLRSQHRWNDR